MIVAQVLGPETGEAIRALVPEWVLPAVVVLTELGNVATLLALFVLEYWYRDHRRGAHAIGLAVAGMALITALKNVFAVGRPPPSVNVIPISGYSFPSGHATTAAIGYGLLAYDFEVGPKWARYTVAGAVIALVALSRVVLGVHWTRDVVAGVVIGLAFLVVAIPLTRRDPARGFVVGIAVAVVAVVASGASHDAVAVFGAAVGGLVTWWLLPPVPRLTEPLTEAALLVTALPALLALGYVGTLSAVPRPVAFLVNVVLIAAVLVVPFVAVRFESETPHGAAATGGDPGS